MFGERHSAPLGNLSVIEALGSASWLAQHPLRGRCVLSVDAPDVIEDKHATLARMAHPGVRHSLGSLTVRQGTAHVTSYLPGVPLARLDRERFLERPGEAADIGIALLAILEHAHGRGVVHGRIAARHVIVGPTIGLVGFGQAPPGAHQQDDLDAVGALLFELVTGEPWSTWSPRVTWFAPELGGALDAWLDTLIATERTMPTRRLRSMLRAVASTLPPPPDGVVASR